MGLTLVLLFLGIFLSYKINWKISIIYFPIAYIVLVALNWGMDIIGNRVFHKLFKVEDEKTEFYIYFENEFIHSFFEQKKENNK